MKISNKQAIGYFLEKLNKGEDIKKDMLFSLMGDDLIEAYEERAAIMEYHGGLEREKAENEALKLTLASYNTLFS